MKRTIKFRAWDRKQKKMEYWGHPEQLYDNIFWYMIKNESMPLMQFTGLTDKNGKEIYEGDIVRILYTDWPSKDSNDIRTLDQYLTDIAQIGKIEYVDYEFVIKIFSKKYDSYYSSSIIPGRYGFIEVIGNIFENPELLTKP